MAEQLAEMDRLEALYKQDHNEEHLRAQFRVLDADHDGSVTVAEVKHVLRAQIGDEAELAANFIVALGDKNDDGVLSIEEFVELSKKMLS